MTTVTDTGSGEGGSRPGPKAPERMLVVLLDSLNRHQLGSYGGTEFATPNLDRFAKRSTQFTNHVTGSLPCMPARHDILVGALDFLWRCWGSIEIWEESIVASLRRSGVTTALFTDHPHLFETGGENYHTDFHAWDYTRGHEGDPWCTEADASFIGSATVPDARPFGWYLQDNHDFDPGRRAYDNSRTWFRAEADFPGPKTMAATAKWLRQSADQHESWFVFVDEFDPHEPFDVPEPWLGQYWEEPWDEEMLIWPPYAIDAVGSGRLTASAGRHIRANYGAKLSMIDDHLGNVLDALDEGNLWDTTAVIVCTDHGHYLGDERGGRDIWGKPAVPQFEPLGHTPLFIHWPGVAEGQTCDALTTNVDLHATIAAAFGAGVDHRTHGESLIPLLTGEAVSVRDWAIGGVFGNWVQVTDGRRKYARAPDGDNFPLSMWSNRWSTMPTHISGFNGLVAPDSRALLDQMPGSTVPVIRQPFVKGDMLPFWVANDRIVGDHHLYDLDVDPHEQERRSGGAMEREMLDLLRTALAEVDAPAEQSARLGL